MKITAFSVENIRSIRAKVSIEDLGPWEVLHGDNNVGKSNLLLGLRTALGLMDKVWGSNSDANDDSEPGSQTIPPGVALLGNSEVPSALAPHWDRANEPIRLSLRFTEEPEPPSLWVTFRLVREGALWRVEGVWIVECAIVCCTGMGTRSAIRILEWAA